MQEAQKKHLVESIHTVVGIVKSSCDHHLFVRGTKLDFICTSTIPGSDGGFSRWPRVWERDQYVVEVLVLPSFSPDNI